MRVRHIGGEGDQRGGGRKVKWVGGRRDNKTIAAVILEQKERKLSKDVRSPGEGVEIELTFMMATCPPARGALKAGLSPSELAWSMGPVRVPLCPIKNDCKAPCVSSLTALDRISNACISVLRGGGPVITKRRWRGDRKRNGPHEYSLENALVRWMEGEPRRVGTGRRLVEDVEGRRVGVEQVGDDKGRVSAC